jgi:hypothetical protein
MHPTISSQLAEARIADLRRQADQRALVRAARQARRARLDDGGASRTRRTRGTAGVLARRLRAVLVARSG